MRWKKLKETIIEHPYLICDDFHMSMRQASRLQEQEGYPSFEEMVASARKRSNLPDTAWEGVYAVIDKQKGRTSFDYLRHLKTPDRRLTARWVIFGMCILLVVGYFTLIPSGKALAASIAKIIVEIFDDGLLFTPSSTPVPSPNSGSIKQTTKSFPNFKAAEEYLGHTLLQIRSDDFFLDTLSLYDNGVAGNLLAASYKTSEGRQVTLIQEWNMYGSSWVELNTANTWEELLWDNKTILYCYIDTADDNKFTATGVWDKNRIQVYADKSIPYQTIISALYAE